MESLKTVTLNDDFALPTKPHKPEVNANTMILFGKEKCGKTTAISQLEDCLIIDTELGSRKVESLSIMAPQDRGPVGKMQWLKKLAEKLVESGKKYDYVAIDTLTEVNEWSEWSGTFRYMNSIQGKSFNRVKDERGNPIRGGEYIDPSDDDYMSVHTLPDGNGYRWSRDEMLQIIDLFNNVAKKCVIYVCHVEDKYVGMKENTEVVVPKQLALTGKLRDILPRKVDAIGYVYNDKGTIKVNFAGTDERSGGSRAKHLQGYNDVLDWKKIFI
jgi:hypothetical protein